MKLILIRAVVVMYLLVSGGMVFAAETKGKTLIVGSEPDFPPFAIGQTDGTIDGFTVELWKEVAKEMGLSYTIHVSPLHQTLKEFKKGKIDVLINFAPSDERRRFADFSIPHVIAHGAVFVRRGKNRIRSETDLADKSIIVLNADLAQEYAISRGWGKKLVTVATVEDGFKLLASGQYDAMLLSRLTGIYTLKKLNISNIRPLDIQVGFAQKFSFAVREGNAELLATINEGLTLTKADGTYDKIYEKWFGLYDEKEVTFRHIFPYLTPFGLIFLGLMAYLFHKRRLERRQSIEEVRQREISMRHMLDTSPIAIRISKLDDREIIFANHSYAQLINVDFREVLKTDPSTYYANKEQCANIPNQLKKGESIINKLIELAIPNVGTKWVLASYFIIRFEDQLCKLGWFYDVSNLKHTEDALLAKETELRQLYIEVQTMREEERRGFAREMHDELGQVITAMRINLSLLEAKLPEIKPVIVNKLKAMHGLIDQAVSTIRRISDEMRPSMLDNLGLSAAIENHVAKFQKLTGITCDLTIGEDHFYISDQSSINLFRIFQEALTNTARHSGASLITIHLQRRHQEIVLTIQDNGHGLPLEVTEPGRRTFGLLGMRERATLLGGSISMSSEPNVGVGIEVIIPADQGEEVA